MKIKYIILIWCLTFVILSFLSCKREKNEENTFTLSLYEPQFTNNFKISGNSDTSNTMISVFNPWQGANNEMSSLVIVRDSEKLETPKGEYIIGNAERIVCMSSTHVAMLEALGATEKIVGVSGKQYISNPYIRTKDEIPDVGYEGNMNYETLVGSKPDLVLLFSVNGASSMEQKLKELKIPFIYIGDYVEEDPLGKTEWIVPLAEIIGEREKGIQKFKEIQERYTILKDKVKKESIDRPNVMVNAPFTGSWFMPSTQSYVARMIEDAGGSYIYDKNTGSSSMPIDMEEALSLVSQADFWINIGSVDSRSELLNSFPKFSETSCVIKGNIYNNNRLKTLGGGNDCYESGVINPDLVLRDMIKIFHPELIKDDLYYYHRLD